PPPRGSRAPQVHIHQTLHQRGLHFGVESKCIEQTLKELGGHVPLLLEVLCRCRTAVGAACPGSPRSDPNHGLLGAKAEKTAPRLLDDLDLRFLLADAELVKS